MIYTHDGKLYNTECSTLIASGTIMDGNPLHAHELEVWRTENLSWFQVYRHKVPEDWSGQCCPNGNNLRVQGILDGKEAMRLLESINAYEAVAMYFKLDIA